MKSNSCAIKRLGKYAVKAFKVNTNFYEKLYPGLSGPAERSKSWLEQNYMVGKI